MRAGIRSASALAGIGTVATGCRCRLSEGAAGEANAPRRTLETGARPHARPGTRLTN
jgi:hypothetical protein